VPLDVFLLLDRDIVGVQIPSESELHEDLGKGYAIELKGYHFGIKNSTTIGTASGGAGAGKASFEQLIVTKQVDQLSPALMGVCAMGGHFKEAKLILRKPSSSKASSGGMYSTFTLRMVAVSGVQWTTSNVDDVAEEHVTLSFGAMQIEYRAQDKTGRLSTNPVVAAWSTSRNSDTLEV